MVDKTLHDTLYELLEIKHIDTYSFLDAKDLRIIQPHLMPQNINSAFFWLLPYYTGKHESRNVSLYAVSKDYHLLARDLAKELEERLSAEFSKERFYFFCDSSPINEVDAAVKCGLGVLGCNRLIINPKYGSYVFIGCMLTTARVDAKEASRNYTEGKTSCIGCGACKAKCTCLRGDGGVCHSALNQTKSLTDEELFAVRSRKIRWGCDDCQEICPMNGNVQETPLDFFREDIIEVVTKEYLDGVSKEDFRKRAYSWRGKKVIQRNIENNALS